MNAVTLNFRADEQKLTTNGVYLYASNTVEYIKAVFDLGANWSGFDSVRAVWYNDFETISKVLDSNGECTVPHEVLARHSDVYVNLVGSNTEDDELVDRLTTYPLKAIEIDANTRVEGTETAPVTPSQFEQYIAIVEQIVGTVKDIDHTELTADYCLIIYYTDGTNSGKLGPIRGATGATGNGIASATLNPDYTLTLTYTNGQHDTVGPIRGAQGETGNGIESIYLTGTSGAVKTYTILFTDGNTTEFQVTDGEVTNAVFEQAFPTDTASGAIASFPDGSDLFYLKSCEVTLEPIQDLSHGDPSPSNICPISGRDSVGVVDCGFNVWDEVVDSGRLSPSTGELIVDNTRVRSKNYIPVKPNTAYYFYCGAGKKLDLFAYDKDKNFVGVYHSGEWSPSSGGADIGNQALTVPENCYYLKFYCVSSYGSTYNNDISITYPSTDTSYHAYNPNSHSVTIPLGQTVYGGVVDCVSGVMTILWAIANMGDLQWSTSDSTPSRFRATPNPAFKSPTTTEERKTGFICSAFAHANNASLNPMDDQGMLRYAGEIFVRDTHYVDANAFKASVNGQQLCYELATPIVVQLTPTQISILKGQNNIFSDSGDVDVTYKADIPLWVEKKLAE